MSEFQEYICSELAGFDFKENGELRFKLWRGDEEVIRCRDCAHMFEMMDGFECERRSGQYHTCEPNGFCAWAERRQV